MTPRALGLVLAAALLHAVWNALAKRAEHPFAFLWSSVSTATCLLAPFAIVIGLGRGVPRAAWPFLAATVALHAVYFWTLGRAYRSADFSVAYPVARGLGVALVPVLALGLLGERLSLLGAAGVGLVAVGIVTVHGLPRPSTLARRLGPGTGWALLTGVTIAGYSLVDKAGVAHLHPVPYIVLLGAGSTMLLLPAALACRGAVVNEWRHRSRTILTAAAMNLTAYLLVLFAFQLSKTAYVVAAREVSIVLSAAIGVLVFREARARARLAGAALILAGVACIVLAR